MGYELKSFIVGINVHNVLVVFLLAFASCLLQLFEPFPHSNLLLFLFFLASFFALFLEVLGDHFLNTLTSLSFELILLLDRVFQALQIIEMISKAELLNKERITVRAASRWSALMVFLEASSHLTLALSATRATNSKYWNKLPLEMHRTLVTNSALKE